MDGCFGLINQRYRQFVSDIMVQVVNESASSNHAQLYRRSDGSSNCEWRGWDLFFAKYLKPIKGIHKLHHFRFTHQLNQGLFT